MPVILPQGAAGLEQQAINQVATLRVQMTMGILPILAKADFDLAIQNAIRANDLNPGQLDPEGVCEPNTDLEGNEPLSIDPYRIGQAAVMYADGALLALGFIEPKDKSSNAHQYRQPLSGAN